MQVIPLLVALTGCESIPRTAPQQPSQMPSYQELVARYNKNLARVDRLWARTVVELTWHDEKGTHHEQGDGNLIVILPNQVALSIGKLGHTGMWAGCDAHRYWLFDLRKNHDKLFVGTHNQAQRQRSHHWPLPVKPNELTVLLGLTPIQSAPAVTPTVAWDNAAFVIEPVSRRLRLWIDPNTARPVRIDLLDETGRKRVTCLLSRWKRVTLENTPPGALPWAATRLEISLIGQEGEMTLFLSDLTDGRADHKIKDRAFDLDHLIKIFKPTKWVNLDKEPLSQE